MFTATWLSRKRVRVEPDLCFSIHHHPRKQDPRKPTHMYVCSPGKNRPFLAEVNAHSDKFRAKICGGMCGHPDKKWGGREQVCSQSRYIIFTPSVSIYLILMLAIFQHNSGGIISESG
jgi:hypothetical protein